MQQKRLACFQEISNKKYDDDTFIHLTIYDIPASLLRDFCRKIVRPYYPGGVSGAIKDLMQKTVLNKNRAKRMHGPSFHKARCRF
jgi:hypothetical protein